jgi:hypothetical protein
MTTSNLLKRLDKQIAAWGELAADDQFAGMKLADFKEVAKELEATVAAMDRINALARGGVKARAEAEKKSMRLSKRVSMAIKSHPDHGEDSQLLRACGFKPESEIRSGRRRSNTATTQETSQTGLLQ